MTDKNILLYEFGGLGEQAIERAFRRLGYNVIPFYYKSDNYDTDQELLNRLASQIDKKKPIMVFSINFLPIVSKVCQVYRIPYMCWVYDCPELHLYSRAITNPVNRIFVFDRLQYERFHRRSPQTIMYMPLATEPLSKTDMSSIIKEERKRYEKDITFIGSLYNEKDKRFHDLEALSQYWRGYVEGIVQAQLRIQGDNILEYALNETAVASLKKELGYVLIDDYCGMDREIIADQFIGNYCSSLERYQTLLSIGRRFSLTIYTGSSTRELERALLRHAGEIDNQGVADSITMMPKIFHCSRININITSRTIQSGIPLRVFDVLGSMGFLITNYRQELYEYFEPGKDMIVYRSLEELNEYIAYYLEHEEERRAIAEHGYQTVCENYTYEKAITLMLELINRNKIL